MAAGNQVRTEIASLFDRADIEKVASKLGLQLDLRKRSPQRAICPFHDDSDPSLYLYRSKGGRDSRDHYHCFVCGAHGDVVSLIQNVDNRSFWEAVEWLANLEGFALSRIERDGVDKWAGAKLIEESLDNNSVDQVLSDFAKERGFTKTFLRKRGIGALDLGSLVSRAQNDRVVEEQLRRAGIVRREELAGDSPDLYGTRVRGFYYGTRIVVPVYNSRGDTVGFAARAIDQTKPKYLFSYDFPKRDILFGERNVTEELTRRSRQKVKTPVDLYLVEGVFDVLRLETFGYLALGLLGAQMTSGQAESLKNILSLADDGSEVRVHIFLDNDEAGFRGAHDAILRILPLLKDGAPFSLDVIWPRSSGTKVDPDAFLINNTAEEIGPVMKRDAISVLRLLGGFRLGVDPREVDWKSIGRLRTASIARQVALSAKDVPWRQVTLLSDREEGGFDEFEELVAAYGNGGSFVSSEQLRAKLAKPVTDTRSDLLSALILGRSSATRREYPLDDDSWERLAIAASPLFHVHCKRLEIGDGPSTPFLTREVPKGGGRYRLKSGPAAYDALIQQHALIELLRDRDACTAFAEQVPAIRYSSDRPKSSEIYKTGGKPSSKVLSFAYQIDMAVVNGLVPPRREGIFRPYFECWRAFVDHIDDCIRKFRYDEMQIVRLDVTGFYDFVKRDVVSQALVGPLELALQSLATSEGRIASFAPLFRPDLCDSAPERAEAFIDFLLSHSFGYQYHHPATGKIETSNAKRGIPQGPDLSAYLANISLFDLDEMMEEELALINSELSEQDAEGQETYAAGYARYVDDVVIICRDIETASHLRRKIEARVASKGLSLNRKNVIPPPMTRAEARAWVTDNRSGFGFSGPLADLPEINAMDPLADAGEIDRKTALGLLFDPELDKLNNPENILQKISLALRAGEIRFNDRANAFRRLWCLAAYEVDDNEGAASLAEKYLEIVDACEPLGIFQGDAEHRLNLMMASLEGLDRALRASYPPGSLPDEMQQALDVCKGRLSKAIITNVFEPLAKKIADDADLVRQFLGRYDIRCHIALIACMAAQVSAAAINSLEHVRHLLEPGGGVTSLPDSIRNSLLRFDNQFSSRVNTLMVSRERVVHAVSSRLDQTVAQLQRLASFGETEEPANFEPVTSVDPNDFVQVANEILQVWSPNENSNESENGHPATNVEFDAASSLVNVAHSDFAGLARRRARLRFLIAGTVEATPIPSPPGLETAGILLWCDGSKLVFASANGVDPVPPSGVSWKKTKSEAVQGVTLREAILPQDYVLLAAKTRHWEPSEIASLYRAAYPLFAKQTPPENDVVPVPTAFCFFVKMIGEAIDFQSLKLICWSASRASVDGHAFVRNGGVLEAKSVFSDGADLWRLGWAVRDVCDRAEVSTDHDGGLEAHAGTALDKDLHRREAIISRVLPRLSGADHWGAGRTANLETIPTRIERSLNLLEMFTSAPSTSEAATCLLAAVAEGLYMSERIGAQPYFSLSGGPSMMMTKAAQRVSRGLPEVTKHWPILESTTTSVRRTTLSWHCLSQKVEQASKSLNVPAVKSLEVLSVSLETLAALTDLRALAFEICAVLSNSSLQILSESEIDLSLLSENVGEDLLLIEGEPSAQLDLTIKEQSKALLGFFGRVASGSRGLGTMRDRISPAGWITIVAVLLQVIPLKQTSGSRRPHLLQMTAERAEKSKSAILTLLNYFSFAPEDKKDTENWPWDLFGPSSRRRPGNLIEVLSTITGASAINITTEVSWTNPRGGEKQEGRHVLRLPDGSSVGLSDWQIDVAHVKGERGGSMETRSEGNRIQFIYSTSRRGDQVVGLHLVSQRLASSSFGGSSSPANVIGNGHVEQVDHEKPNQQSDYSDVTPKSTDRTTDEKSTIVSPFDALVRIREAQLKSWSARRNTKNAGMQRVALVQWDVTDTYYSPGRELGKLEELVTADGLEPVGAIHLEKGGVFLSKSEARRRALLKEVLSTCAEFGVDGLVLPEYSLRPETVNWLSRQLRQRAQPITVWCGTFRIPDGTQLEVGFSSNGNGPYRAPLAANSPAGVSKWDHHTAILTCLQATVSAKEGVRVDHFMRQKRYPSSAAGELIRPPADVNWRPLLQDESSPFKLGSFTLELICSEMFPHASSANFIGIVEENNELADRYGVARSGMTMFEHISKDIFEFAKWTAYRNVRNVPGDASGALIRGERLQRTLIILPAMTNRSADYHVFGQNQYLAAGLVTVFCNAVSPPVGCGQSGFIGLDGWKQTEAAHTPYGSQAPGIFQLGGKHSGPLGTKESAIVIADLDLLRTADQRPRPHYQQRSLRLVAHLPLIFSTEKVLQTEGVEKVKKRRDVRFRHVADSPMNLESAFSLIAEALDSEEDWRRGGNVAHHEAEIDNDHKAAVDKVQRGLKVLEVFADDASWLRKRTASFTSERYEYPPMSPLPALVDWIYVDDRWPGLAEISSDNDIDPYSVDAPFIVVPRSTREEPPHQ